MTRARKEGRIKDDFAVKTLIDELNIFRGGCGGMLNYDWISIPLVYTQVILEVGINIRDQLCVCTNPVNTEILSMKWTDLVTRWMVAGCHSGSLRLLSLITYGQSISGPK